MKWSLIAISLLCLIALPPTLANGAEGPVTPQPQTSHEPGLIIKVHADSKSPVIHDFCLNREGNLLIACGGTRSLRDPADPSGRSRIKTEEPAEIHVVNPEGNQLAVWPLETEPRAICLGDGGTVFVGGPGKLVKLDKDGKVLLTADAPNAAELPPPVLEPEKKTNSQGEDAEATRKAKQKKSPR